MPPGIRRARATALDGVRALLAPLEKAGVLVKRSKDDVAQMLPDFIVIERETKVGQQPGLKCFAVARHGRFARGSGTQQRGCGCA